MATEVSNIIKADVNFIVIQGDTFDASVTFKDSNQQPLNFTGATLLMSIFDSADISKVTLQNGAGFTVTGNTVKFNFVPGFSFQPDTYFYDLQCEFASGLKKTLIGGKFKVLKQITSI
jgi:hypothetical protein